MQNRLGKVEHIVLSYLKEKPWRSGMGVIYNTLQHSTRVLENLCKKGLVVKTNETRKHHLLGDDVYTITQAGLDKLQ